MYVYGCVRLVLNVSNIRVPEDTVLAVLSTTRDRTEGLVGGGHSTLIKLSLEYLWAYVYVLWLGCKNCLIIPYDRKNRV